MKRLITLCFVSLLIANVFCASAFAAQTYNKTIRPIGHGYGATLLATTTPAHPNTGYYSRLGSTGAISRAKVVGSNLWKVFGAQADFEYATGTAADGSYYSLPYNCPANGIVGFYFTFNPSNPDNLTVTRQLIATNDYQNAQANWISDLGIGGVSENGTVSLRVDNYSTMTGSNADCGVGTLKADSTSTFVFQNSFASSGDWTWLAGGYGNTYNWTQPAIGQSTDLMMSSSFKNRVGAFRANFNDYSGSSADYAQYWRKGQNFLNNTNSVYHRGTFALNDSCKRAAIARSEWTGQYDPNSPTTKVYACFMLRIGSYVDNGTSITWTDLNPSGFNFKDAIPGKDCYLTNFYGQGAYRGPSQISMNDQGDIVFTVVVLDDNEVPYKTGLAYPRLAVLFAPHDNYNNFKVVATNYDDNDPDSTMLFYDYRNPAAYKPCISAAIDNDRNVFIMGTNWTGIWNSRVVTSNALFKATPNNKSNPTSWSMEPIAWRGMLWADGSDIYEIAYMPTGSSSKDYEAVPAIFDDNNLNRRPIPGKTDNRYSIGGLILTVGLSKTPPPTPAELIHGTVYIAPTDSAVPASSVAACLSLEENTPVNLWNCYIASYDGEYEYTPEGSTQPQTRYVYTIFDKSHGYIKIYTIRSTTSELGALGVGDEICVSGKISVINGSKAIWSTGLVLVHKAKDVTRPTVGVNNRAIGNGYGLSTVGRWVTAWGAASNVDWDAGTMNISDGDSNVITIDFSEVKSAIATPVNGKTYSLTGVVTSGSPATIKMYPGDNLQQIN